MESVLLDYLMTQSLPILILGGWLLYFSKLLNEYKKVLEKKEAHRQAIIDRKDMQIQDQIEDYQKSINKFLTSLESFKSLHKRMDEVSNNIKYRLK